MPSALSGRQKAAANLGIPIILLVALANAQAPVAQRSVYEGISVELSLNQVDLRRTASGTFREGDDVQFRFKITDIATGNPVNGASPAAWLKLRTGSEPPDQQECTKSVANFVTGNPLSKAEVDLNAYHVLALNGDASISVVDPLFGFGGSRLLTMVPLEGRGGDWALTADQDRLFVSVPGANRLSIVETASWKVVGNVEAGSRPSRVVLEPDEHYVWVSYGFPADSRGESGVVVVSTDTMAVAARIPTGKGPHDIAISSDSSVGFVTNAGDGTVSLIDVRTLSKLKDLRTGSGPISIAFSPLSQRAYVTHQDGGIAVLDGTKREQVARIQAEPGLGQIRFAPGGRLGFAANPEKNVVHVIDSAANRIVQTADFPKGPDQISFSERLAYVRQRDSDTVFMIPLDGLGVPGKPIFVADFTGGQNPLGKVANPTPASTIIQAPGESAVLVANPADKSIYYYQEGMAAPLGSFSNYSQEPRAVLVVDRSLRPSAPGVYQTVTKLKSPGQLDVVFFLDTPRVLHCFSVLVEADPILEAKRRGEVTIESLIENRVLHVGEKVRLRFRLTDPSTHEPKTALNDVQVLSFLVPGLLQERKSAETSEPGIYEVDFTPQQAGIYRVAVSCRSLGLTFDTLPPYILEAN
jgi:YVTN family beta-propeller protein